MVTLTDFLALNNFPSALMTPMISLVFAIFTRVETVGNVLLDRLKCAAIGLTLPDVSMVMLSTLAKSVETVTGTTAPFSAILGAFIFILSSFFLVLNLIFFFSFFILMFLF